MKYTTTLTSADRRNLEKLTTSGVVAARVMKRAQILLLSDRSLG
jgi:hypothetical protein